MDENDSLDEFEEKRQLRRVIKGFKNYHIDSMKEVARMERNLWALSADDKSELIEPVQSRIDNIKAAVSVNRYFIHALISANDDYIEEMKIATQCTCNRDKDSCVDKASSADTPDKECYCKECDDDLDIHGNNEPSICKVRTTLRQFVRDWSLQGKPERDIAYGLIIAALEEIFPLEEFKREYGRVPRVLCPGSGLGRLPFEVARRGFKFDTKSSSASSCLETSAILSLYIQ
eukprot:GHVO01063896.1.p1 GENE.GHVO01063896.1~~GHVO01063896.1.p1  ORF type:complete len:232 (+),score=38.56 GHVO01063896.1:20-715(+)